jgi:eukaryotic-like serine/threonine-protein kinase
MSSPHEDGWESPLAERYRLDGLLGGGAVADVHRAKDTRLRRPVVIKLFHPDTDPVAQRRFRDEARVLAQLSHPGLVSILDAGIDNARAYLVMQLVDGESLRSRLLSGPLVSGTAVRLGITLATTIEHVHRCGMVHQDVNPANILLDVDGGAYLAGIGIALLTGAVGSTDAGEIVSTGDYFAPEQTPGQELPPAIDVYALGLVLLECLTSELVQPADAERESALIRPYRTPSIPSSVPPRLAELLAAMTAPEPAGRPTAQQCVAALRALDPLTPMADWPTMVAVPEPLPATPPVDLAARPIGLAGRAHHRQRSHALPASGLPVGRPPTT